MFAIDPAGLFTLQKLQGSDKPVPGISGKDHIVDVAPSGGYKRIHVMLSVFFYFFIEQGIRIGS